MEVEYIKELCKICELADTLQIGLTVEVTNLSALHIARLNNFRPVSPESARTFVSQVRLGDQETLLLLHRSPQVARAKPHKPKCR
jgi:hypothetical protein